MRQRFVAILMITSLLLVSSVGSSTHAGPIIKPRKYHGPIPQGAISLRFGFRGGPDNLEMIGFLDRAIVAPFQGESEDFSTSSFTMDLAYTYKLHPQIAVRANASMSLLRSTGDGFYVPRTGAGSIPDSVLSDVVNYDRSFDVDLFVLELSALYFFSDASVQEFQPYMGGGFSIGMPHAKFKEERVSQVSGQSFPYEADQWSGEAGVHGILGAYYYVTNRFAFSAESRIDILQSKFPLSATNEVGQPEAVKLDVTYSGFVITFGISRSF